MSLADIKLELKAISEDDLKGLKQFVDKYKNEEKSGIVSVCEQARKKLQKLEMEFERSENMLIFERKYIDLGYDYICGIDEVGRGPLAGPVVACAVILSKDDTILYLNDSKQVSKKKREELYDIITQKAVSYGIGIVSEQIIDEKNILQATYEAMRIAISNLSVQPDLLLIDAVKIPEVPYKQVPIVKGDTLSASIAAASIVGKVTRDRLMEEYDKVYPGYDFAKNSGYGTANHIKAIKEEGPSPIHRKTFIKKFV